VVRSPLYSAFLQNLNLRKAHQVLTSLLNQKRNTNNNRVSQYKPFAILVSAKQTAPILLLGSNENGVTKFIKNDGVTKFINDPSKNKIATFFAMTIFYWLNK